MAQSCSATIGKGRRWPQLGYASAGGAHLARPQSTVRRRQAWLVAALITGLSAIPSSAARPACGQPNDGVTIGRTVVQPLTTPTIVGEAGPTAVSSPSLAADIDARVASVARQLHCPICQGYTLWDCPLEVCQQMRQQIRELLSAGWSEAAVREHFVQLYGPQVLNAPPLAGLYLLAWVVPLALGALALAAVLVRVRQSWRGTAPGTTARAEANGAHASRFDEWIDDA